MPRDPDSIFADDRLAVLYDHFEGSREDLDAYVAMANEFGAQRVLDIGCGTGELALQLAALGFDVVGIDPAVASVRLARAKPLADAVRWIVGDATALPVFDPPLEVDMAVMTGNVAQVFIDDTDWDAVLASTAHALVPGGHLVFETRDPARRAWEDWTPESSRQVGVDADGDRVETWNEVTALDGPLVTFEGTFQFADGSIATSTSTLRFRSREEVEASLTRAGFDTIDVRDAPDRPGREFVFVAVRQ